MHMTHCVHCLNRKLPNRDGLILCPHLLQWLASNSLVGCSSRVLQAALPVRVRPLIVPGQAAVLVPYTLYVDGKGVIIWVLVQLHVIVPSESEFLKHAGYGDIVPGTYLELGFSILAMLCAPDPSVKDKAMFSIERVE